MCDSIVLILYPVNEIAQFAQSYSHRVFCAIPSFPPACLNQLCACLLVCLRLSDHCGIMCPGGLCKQYILLALAKCHLFCFPLAFFCSLAESCFAVTVPSLPTGECQLNIHGRHLHLALQQRRTLTTQSKLQLQLLQNTQNTFRRSNSRPATHTKLIKSRHSSWQLDSSRAEHRIRSKCLKRCFSSSSELPHGFRVCLLSVTRQEFATRVHCCDCGRAQALHGRARKADFAARADGARF